MLYRFLIRKLVCKELPRVRFQVEIKGSTYHQRIEKEPTDEKSYNILPSGERISRYTAGALVQGHLPAHRATAMVGIIAERGTGRMVRNEDNVLGSRHGDAELLPDVPVRRGGLVARATGAAELRAGAVARGGDVAAVPRGVGIAGAADRRRFGVDGGRGYPLDRGRGGVEEDESDRADGGPHLCVFSLVT